MLCLFWKKNNHFVALAAASLTITAHFPTETVSDPADSSTSIIPFQLLVLTANIPGATVAIRVYPSSRYGHVRGVRRGPGHFIHVVR